MANKFVANKFVANKFGANKAFSLIEILIVLSVIAILYAGVTKFRSPEDTWTYVLGRLNELTSFAKQEAIIKRKVHKLVFISKENSLDSVSIWVKDSDKYMEVKTIYDTVYKLPEDIKISAVYIDKKEESLEKEVNVYISTDGLIQETVIHLTRHDLARHEKSGDDKKTFKVNPFIGSFEMFDGFRRFDKAGLDDEE